MRSAALLLFLFVACAGCNDGTDTRAGGTGAASPTLTVSSVNRPAPSPSMTATATARTGAVPGRAAPGTRAPASLLVAEPPATDRIDLARRLRGVTAPPAATSFREEQTGERRDFWVVQSDPPRAFQVTAILRTVSQHAYFYVQDSASVTDADLQRAARDFEQVVYPTVARTAGEPTPIAVNPDPRITILHLRLPGVGGYFTGIDQLPRAIQPMSNERAMVYIDLRAGPPGTDAYPGLVAHELQHLVHHRLNPNADAWLNEGLSEVVDEIAGGGENSLRSWRDAPSTQLTDWAVSGNNAAHYGAAHSFLRYLLRHYGGVEQLAALASLQLRGVNAVERYLQDGGHGVSFEDVYADWLATGYLAEPAGRYANPGVDTRVRTITRLRATDSGSATLNQFGAEYYEIQGGERDGLFRLRGPATIKAVPPDPASGSGFWWSGRADSADTLLTRSIDLTAVRSATLRFKLWFDIERGYDYGYVLASVDNGATWKPLIGKHTTDYDPLGQAYGSGYTGISGGGGEADWVSEEMDLTPFAGRKLLLRFEYITDESAVAAGMAIDDISVPEIGLTDAAESDGVWGAEGFQRLTGPLPQRYLVLAITRVNGVPSVRRVEVSAEGAADVIVGAGEVTAIVIAGATHGTNLTNRYRWEYSRDGN